MPYYEKQLSICIHFAIIKFIQNAECEFKTCIDSKLIMCYAINVVCS